MVIAELGGNDYDDTPQTAEESVPESPVDIEGMGSLDDELFALVTP